LAKLILFVLPLGLDTFAVAAALGVAGLPARQRLKISALMSGFELTMPIIGLLLGRGLGGAIGSTADYAAVANLFALGVYLLVSDDDSEADRVAALAGNSGIALLALGLSISPDELAMGFTIGLLHLSLPFAAILIGAQAFLVAQLGLRLGSRIGAAARERTETLAGIALLGIGRSSSPRNSLTERPTSSVAWASQRAYDWPRLYMLLIWPHHGIEIDSRDFWFQMQIGIILGYFTAWPSTSGSSPPGSKKDGLPPPARDDGPADRRGAGGGSRRAHAARDDRDRRGAAGSSLDQRAGPLAAG
jgi:putative Mn2+ efflux pump MntP